MWQKCPVCNGFKQVNNPNWNGTNPMVITCPVCNGTGIINEITGLPPGLQAKTIGTDGLPVNNIPSVWREPRWDDIKSELTLSGSLIQVSINGENATQETRPGYFTETSIDIGK